MIKSLFFVCFLLLVNLQANAGLNILTPNSSINIPQSGCVPGGKQSIVQNGTLTITMQAAPVSGLPMPKILIMQGLSAVMQSNVNWGNTWSLNVPSGNYRIIPLPVSDGTHFYIAHSVSVSLPANVVVNKLIAHHVI